MNIKNELGLPQPFVEAVTKEYEYKEKQYSVTALLKGVCQIMLERRHHGESEQDVADMVWMIFGTAVHSILENAKESDTQLKENKLVIDVGDYKLSGIFDLYDEATKTVTDYKSSTVWKIIYNEFEDWEKQLLMYAWMLEKIGFECKHGEIVALLKDHSKTKAKTDHTYPQFPVYKIGFDFDKNDLSNIEKQIIEKFELIKKAEVLSDDELPPCTPEERWYSGSKYAVMKKGRKAALRLVDTEEQAKEYMEWKGIAEKDHYIEFRAGENKKCNEYCNVNIFCPFYKKLKGDNENE